MASTSMSLGKHWEEFLKEKVKSGKYGSATDVVRAALRDMEAREEKLARLQAYIKEGEDSGYTEWDADAFKNRMREKYAQVAEGDAEAFTHEN